MFIKNGQIMKIGQMIQLGFLKINQKSSKNTLNITRRNSEGKLNLQKFHIKINKVLTLMMNQFKRSRVEDFRNLVHLQRLLVRNLNLLMIY
jgi:hypothetical protein